MRPALFIVAFALILSAEDSDAANAHGGEAAEVVRQREVVLGTRLFRFAVQTRA